MNSLLERHRYTLMVLLSGAILVGSGVSLGIGLVGNGMTEGADAQPFGLEGLKPSRSTGEDSTSQAVIGKTNINTASIDELDLLPGIGPVYAQRIVDYRRENGRFQIIAEITNISGVGPKTFEKLKDLITVK